MSWALWPGRAWLQNYGRGLVPGPPQLFPLEVVGDGAADHCEGLNERRSVPSPACLVVGSKMLSLVRNKVFDMELLPLIQCSAAMKESKSAQVLGKEKGRTSGGHDLGAQGVHISGTLGLVPESVEQDWDRF